MPLTASIVLQQAQAGLVLGPPVAATAVVVQAQAQARSMGYLLPLQLALSASVLAQVLVAAPHRSCFPPEGEGVVEERQVLAQVGAQVQVSLPAPCGLTAAQLQGQALALAVPLAAVVWAQCLGTPALLLLEAAQLGMDQAVWAWAWVWVWGQE